MNTRNGLARLLATPLLLVLGATALAQDANITQPIADLERLLAAEPLVITQAEISRPKAKGDITLRADVSFGGAPPLRVKLRKAEPGADSFNNVPRYDLAAYELQKLFIDPAEYVVPPTALRMIPRQDFVKYQADVVRTFSSADQVLAVLQYWLSDIAVVADVYDPARFDADAVYARHVGQLNVLTYLIEHRDSNVGNFLIGKSPMGARVFSIDHGVAFASKDSDRGEAWKDIRVSRLPADTVAKLRTDHRAGARAATRRAGAMEARGRSLRPRRPWAQPFPVSRRAARRQRPADGPHEERDLRRKSPARPPAPAYRCRRDRGRGDSKLRTQGC